MNRPGDTMPHRLVRLLALSTIAVLLCGRVDAQPSAPRLLPFQGRLTDQNGVAVTNGVRLVQFKIYDAPSAGATVWAGELHRTTVNGGLVNVLLGTKTPFALTNSAGGQFFDQQLYLEITVDINGDGQITAADPLMLPRQVLLPVIFAKEAAFAENSSLLTGHDWSVLFGTNNPANSKIEGTKIGDVQGDLSISGNLRLAPGVGAYGAGRIQVASPGDVIGITLNSSSRVWDVCSITSGSFDYFAIRDHTAEALRLMITQDGQVGIGRTPREQLDVEGTVRATSFEGSGTGLTSISTGNLADQAVTLPKLAPRPVGQTVSIGGVAISAHSGPFETTGTTFVDVPNLQVTIETSGRPVWVCLVAAASPAPDISVLESEKTNVGYGTVLSIAAFLRDGTVVALQGIGAGVGLSAGKLVRVPPSSLAFIDFPAPGQHTYKLQVRNYEYTGAYAGTWATRVRYCRLVAYEL